MKVLSLIKYKGGFIMNIDELLSKLTLEEKVRLLAGKSSWCLNGVERLGIPEINVTDGPHGVRWSDGFDFSSLYHKLVTTEHALNSTKHKI